MDEADHLIAADPVLSKNLALVRSITGFGEVSATISLAELPNIAESTPKALAAVHGAQLASAIACGFPVIGTLRAGKSCSASVIVPDSLPSPA